MKFIGYKKCSTSNKAEKWLKEHNIKYTFQDIKIDKPDKDELKSFVEKASVDINKFFNTSGKLYREQGLKDKLKDMTEEEKLELLSQDGMLIKRPIFVLDDKVFVGFKEADWQEYFAERDMK